MSVALVDAVVIEGFVDAADWMGLELDVADVVDDIEGFDDIEVAKEVAAVFIVSIAYIRDCDRHCI